ncbi:MAG: A/G-specific adenine glycosylase [SAR324 cluster bacterium]|nr:A/G-specific adenine glycosylase [SAR324 cluster bacterium]
MINLPSTKNKVFTGKLLAWYRAHQRDLPWRRKPTLYKTVVSEFMLQQTKVDTVIPYYHRFLEKFPTPIDLARASQPDVLKAWEGLGYYSRARNLHRCAREVEARHGGRFPTDLAALRALPGIGSYTAGAIASISFNRPVPAVDGNVARVLSRVFALDLPLNRGRAHLDALAEGLLRSAEPRPLNEGLMELGALVCRPRAPLCPRCPLRRMCEGHRLGAPEAFPGKPPKKPRPTVSGVMVMVERGRRLLLRRRPLSGLWGGLWEFPWLERRPREKMQSVLARLLSDLAVTPESAGAGAKKIGVLRHGLTHLELALTCFRVEVDGPKRVGGMTGEFRWVWRRDLDALPMGRFNRKAITLWDDAGSNSRERPRRGSGDAGARRARVGKRRQMV